MKISESNSGSMGWYEGFLKGSLGKGDDYRLSQAGEEAYLSSGGLLDEVWEDLEAGEMIVLRGYLEQREKITGNSEYWIEGVDRAGVVIEDDFAGRTVGISGTDLLFTGSEDYELYSFEDRGGLEESLEGWFPEESDLLEERLRGLESRENWPWKT